ncbi:hypothetical protein C8J57DRAFT_1482985 [Mycena rebaudengoi]|nr:hypothetical protein C8J57DRAFT_1482985 [Mycena rebaudengoi]
MAGDGHLIPRADRLLLQVEVLLYKCRKFLEEPEAPIPGVMYQGMYRSFLGTCSLHLMGLPSLIIFDTIQIRYDPRPPRLSGASVCCSLGQPPTNPPVPLDTSPNHAPTRISRPPALAVPRIVHQLRIALCLRSSSCTLGGQGRRFRQRVSHFGDTPRASVLPAPISPPSAPFLAQRDVSPPEYAHPDSATLQTLVRREISALQSIFARRLVSTLTPRPVSAMCVSAARSNQRRLRGFISESPRAADLNVLAAICGALHRSSQQRLRWDARVDLRCKETVTVRALAGEICYWFIGISYRVCETYSFLTDLWIQIFIPTLCKPVQLLDGSQYCLLITVRCEIAETQALCSGSLLSALKLDIPLSHWRWITTLIFLTLFLALRFAAGHRPCSFFSSLRRLGGFVLQAQSRETNAFRDPAVDPRLKETWFTETLPALRLTDQAPRGPQKISLKFNVPVSAYKNFGVRRIGGRQKSTHSHLPERVHKLVAEASKTLAELKIFDAQKLSKELTVPHTKIASAHQARPV